jgi:hypothetical protein
MSEIKVNKISPRTACGTTTLGDSGDTFTIPAGVTITNNGTAAGFGATGAASWDTTVKTSGFTAVSGVGYFVNTTAGAISVTLPAGVAGDVVAIKDYANTFDTNNVTLVVNGSDKIGGSNINGTLSTEGLAITLVFVDSTQGWLVTDNGTQNTAPTAQYITATGGTITCSPCGDYKIHTFTGAGTFTVCSVGNAAGSNSVDYLVVAGGGSSGGDAGGAGGGGGTRFSNGTASGSYCAGPSPLGASALPVSVQGYTIAVGGGGIAPPSSCANVPSPTNAGQNGSPSTFSTIVSTAGGGGGGHGPGTVMQGNSGGSGGGSRSSGTCAQGGSGNTPPVSPPQGTPGGSGYPFPNQGGGGAGGGGAIAAGSDNVLAPTPGVRDSGGPGGLGLTSSITGSAVGYGGGGGGGAGGATGAVGGTATQGGGAGSDSPGTPGVGCGTAGTINTGGGGGGGHDNVRGTGGGSGIVIIRYKFQN